MPEVLFLLALGSLVGTVGSLVGAGGGVILVPVLVLLYEGEVASEITSLSLVVIFFTAFSGSVAYGWMRRIDYVAGMAFALAGIPTAMIGAYLSQHVPRIYFDPLMAGLLVLLGGYTLVNPRSPKANSGFARDIEANTRRQLRLGCILSAYIGAFSGVLGIGGGIIRVPVMVKILRFTPHVATATSLFALTIVSFAGTLVHASGDRFEGQSDKALFLAIGVMVGAQVGAKLSTWVRGTMMLRLLSALLVGLGAQLLYTSAQRW